MVTSINPASFSSSTSRVIHGQSSPRQQLDLHSLIHHSVPSCRPGAALLRLRGWKCRAKSPVAGATRSTRIWWEVPIHPGGERKGDSEREKFAGIASSLGSVLLQFVHAEELWVKGIVWNLCFISTKETRLERLEIWDCTLFWAIPKFKMGNSQPGSTLTQHLWAGSAECIFKGIIKVDAEAIVEGRILNWVLESEKYVEFNQIGVVRCPPKRWNLSPFFRCRFQTHFAHSEKSVPKNDVSGKHRETGWCQLVSSMSLSPCWINGEPLVGQSRFFASQRSNNLYCRPFKPISPVPCFSKKKPHVLLAKSPLRGGWIIESGLYMYERPNDFLMW